MKPLSVAVRSVVSVLLFSCVPAANALTQDISALFRPDSSKPNENTFLNTTPVSGYCATYPSECRATKMFSIRLPFVFNSAGPIQANHGDARQGAMFKLPTTWRTTQVTHSVTGETEVVEVRWSGIGSTYRLSGDVIDLVGGGVSLLIAHQRLWNGLSWVYAPSPCRYSGIGLYTNTDYTFFWKTPVEGVCAKGANYLIPGFSYRYLDFAYELRTPNPLKMSSGQYTGSLTYSVGPGQDIDMGDVMLPNDSALTLNFNLEVQHTLQVEVPPGGNRVELVPQEGWQSWLNSGRKPTRLFRDQRFHISASSRFKMALECQIISGNTCAISEAATGHAVPVDVSVSLPDGLTDAAGQPVNRRRLLRDGSGTELFQPGFYVDRRPGTLHFEVARTSVEEMLDSGAKAYTGNVTVIWDSEV
ncbi:hypothetical protein B1219_20720 [Pseudomonas ogarae]|uniref:hypothetical protein n=1 Tax=Pseudomonas ogarae (strain DSM 112162 / CECT 30235 / F113) TaxID=1114970 RepID=UPI0009A3C832|nr:MULTISPECIES: hypothetical protein [Pseudomonas]OPG70250.1 hypothetical protein B1219_20720 [Pseudomonas ogarae]OPG79287.1 hypothetical protein B1218_11220 [Pseudomonas ogarae]PBJ00283.1 hypothetical protein BSF43_53650 [Pseudomonas ogarae]PBJ18583.1 hypothetical protein BSG18_44950 [Pseudomonas ogarae]QXH93831.1 hypothetical protein HU749_023840 [Pseudomonas zarinae]